jgi:hypothetical protein
MEEKPETRFEGLWRRESSRITGELSADMKAIWTDIRPEGVSHAV